MRFRQNRQPPFYLRVPSFSSVSFVLNPHIPAQSATDSCFAARTATTSIVLPSVPRSWLVTPVRSFRKEDHQMTYNEGKFPPRTRLEQAARK